MKYIRFMSVALLALLAVGCPELGTQPVVVTDDIPENPTWVDIKPILDKYCNECHSVPATQSAPATLRLDVCETIGGLPGAQAMSINNVNRTIDQIPSAMPPLTYGIYPSADEQEIMQRWHDQGAPCDGATPTNMMTNNVTPNGSNGDMGMMTTPDMNAPVDMAMNPPDMGVDMAPDLPPPTGPAWSVLGAQLVTTCGTATCHGQAGGRGGVEFADIDTLETVLANENQASNGLPFVRAQFPTQSVIYLKMSDDPAKPGGVMPPGGTNAALTQDVFDWITAGADFTQ